jgi:hypothetical protein
MEMGGMFVKVTNKLTLGPKPHKFYMSLCQSFMGMPN